MKEQLRKAREAKGLTQAALAELLKVGTTTVRAWESGRNIPTLSIRSRLEEILEISLEDLASSQALAPLILGDENRRSMLKRVSSRWISGVLENSLYLATLIMLGLREQPDAVENPWRLIVQESNLPDRLLPPGTRLTDVYDKYDGRLLVLGEPGAGKTTLLLDLTKDLLERAAKNEIHPMPVVFNLSSWVERQLPLAAWIVEELNTKYQIPRGLANEWVSDHKILPLLDGLDEVVEAQRTRCIGVLNESLKESGGMLPMVVCSRNEDYLRQSARLRVHAAVVVQPLTAEQINEYLSSAGNGLDAIQAALQQDEVLKEVASTPLMLSTLAIAYRNRDISELTTGSSVEERRSVVFSNYVDRVLRRRGPVKGYSPEQTKKWLSWLAMQMRKHGQTEFYIERMQPDWLSASHVRGYQDRVTRLVLGVEYFVAASLLPLFPGETRANLPGIFTLLGGGHGSTLLGWMAPGLGGSVRGVASLLLILSFVQIILTLVAGRGGIPNLSKKAIGHAALRGLRNGSISGIVVGLFALAVLGASASMRAGGIGLFSGVLVAVMSGLISLFNNKIAPVHSEDSEHRHWLSIRGIVDRLLDTLLAFGCGTVGAGIVYTFQYGAITSSMFRDALLVGGFYGVVLGLFGLGRAFHPSGLGSIIQPAEVVKWSGTWQAFAIHIKKGLGLGSIIMVSLIVLLAAYSGIFYGLGYGLIYGLIYGGIVGFVTATAGVLTGVMTDGWSSAMLDDRRLTKPNEGIHRSLSNALIAAALFGLLGGLVSGLVCALAFGLAGIAAWPILGAGLAMVLGSLFLILFLLQQGGIAYAAHYILRWYLWRTGALPWNYSEFLDYAAERILLRKVGGGYIFIHRLLLEYFANEEKDQ